MNTISVSLTDEKFLELENRARQLNLSIGELLVATAREMVSRPDEEFKRAMKFVLEKNKELYKRLA